MSLFAYDDDMAPPVGDAAPAPATDARSTARAAREAAYLGGRVDSRDIAYRRAYEPIVEALNAPLRRAGGLTLVSPDAGQFIVNPYRYGRPLDPVAEARGGTAPDEDRLWAEIARRRKTNPGFLPGVPQTQAEFRRQVDARTAEELREAEDIASRGPLWARLLGGVVGGASDPVNIASLPLGAGSAKTVLGTAIREGLTNAGVELLMTPAIAARRAELGQDTSTGDVALNVGAAFTLGGMLGGGIEGLSRWLGGAVVDVGDTALAESVAQALARPVDQDLTRLLADDRAALAAFDTVIAEPTAEQAAARTVLAEKVETDALSPFVETPAGDAAHYERLGAALDALQNDRAIVLPPATVALKTERGPRRPPSLVDDLRAHLREIGRSLDVNDAVRLGAIHPDDLKADVGLKVMFRKSGGISLDELGVWLRERGYDFSSLESQGRATAEQVADAIRRDVAGRKAGLGVYAPDIVEEAYLYRQWLEGPPAEPKIDDIDLMSEAEYDAWESWAIQNEDLLPRSQEGLYDDIPFDIPADGRLPTPGTAAGGIESGRKSPEGASGAGGRDGRPTRAAVGDADAGNSGRDRGEPRAEISSFGDLAGSGADIFGGVSRADALAALAVRAEGRQSSGVSQNIEGFGLFDTAARAQSDMFDAYATPAGPAQQLQADLVQHELEAVLAAPDVPREQAGLAAGFALDLTADGVALRGFDDIMAELDADAAAVRALRECLL